MGFRSELEAKEARLERLRRENEELRDRLNEEREAREREAREDEAERQREEERERLAAASRGRSWLASISSGRSAPAPGPKGPFDPATAPGSLRLGSWLVAIPCLALSGTTCVLFAELVDSDIPIWFRLAMATIFTCWFVPHARETVVLGVKSDGQGGYTRLTRSQRLRSIVFAIAVCVVIGAVFGVSEGDD